MGKTKMNRGNTEKMPNAFYYSFLKSVDDRNGDVETASQLVIGVCTRLHQAFGAFDDAYQRSMASMSSKPIAELDERRDVCGNVMEQVAKQWARLTDDTLSIHGRRVYQVFRDIDFRSTEALTAENAKVQNMEQRFAEAELQADLAAMGLTPVNQQFAQLTAQIIQLMSERNEETAGRVQGEVKAARTALDEVYAEYVEIVNAVIVTTTSPELEQLAALVNADLKKVEEQMAQSKKLPTVLVSSEVVGNHRYSVPEFAKWSDIVEANPKAFKLATNGTNRILSAMPKASKVGGLYLALNGVAVKPTDVVNAKKEYKLVTISGGSDVTPVYPEGDEN